MHQPPVLPGQPCPAGDVLRHAVGAQNVRFGSSRSTTLPHILAISSRDQREGCPVPSAGAPRPRQKGPLQQFSSPPSLQRPRW